MNVRLALRISALSLLLFAVLAVSLPGPHTEKISSRFPPRRYRSETVVELPQVVHIRGQGLCSGFVAAKNRVITAAHCAGTLKIGGNLKVAFTDGRTEEGTIVGLGDQDNRSQDWAVLSVDTQAIMPAPIRKAPYQPVFEVVNVGYPGPSPVQLLTPGLLLSISSNVLWSAITVYQGESGSPLVVGDTGEVIGITVATGEDVPFSLATPISAVPKHLLESK